ncbi:hypothetical protein RF11_00157 [Thelohanellus kitauei]|uniref:Uncharacterized protein n=1 Tax=Thelohanellus kitauei TaxID=669202 RepID=A0A0C2IY54_THEKT|nr:hypothetical protein RF11_00157 [Thelohanellus kitauei]
MLPIVSCQTTKKTSEDQSQEKTVSFGSGTAAHTYLSNNWQSHKIQDIFTRVTFLDPRYMDYKLIKKNQATRRGVIESAKCEIILLSELFEMKEQKQTRNNRVSYR